MLSCDSYVTPGTGMRRPDEALRSAVLVAQSCNRHFKTLLPTRALAVCHHPTSQSVLDWRWGGRRDGSSGVGVKEPVLGATAAPVEQATDAADISRPFRL